MFSLLNLKQLIEQPDFDFELINQHPEQKWILHYCELRDHPNVNLSILVNYFCNFEQTYADKHKLMTSIIEYYILKNPDFDLDLINQFSEFIWDKRLEQIISHSDFTFDVIERFSNLNWYSVLNKIISHSDFTFDVIERFSNLNWSSVLNRIMDRPDFTLDVIERFSNLNWSSVLNRIMDRPDFTLDVIERFSNLDWNSVLNKIMNRPDFTLDVIKQFQDLDWNSVLNKIIKHPEFTFYHIELFQYLKWGNVIVSIIYSDKFNRDILEEYSDINWNCALPYIIESKHFDFTYLIDFPDLDWNSVLHELVHHPEFTLDTIKQFPDLDWMSQKVSITSVILKDGNYDIRLLYEHPELNWSWFNTKKLIRKCSLSYYEICNLIDDFPEKEWHNYMNHLIQYEEFKLLDFIDRYHEIIDFNKVELNIIINHPDFILDIIYNNPNWRWDCYIEDIIMVKDFTIDLIDDFPDWNWKYCHNELIKTKKDMIMDLINKFPEWRWVDNYSIENIKHYLSSDDYYELIDRFPNWNWKVTDIVKRYGLSMEIFNRYPNYNWSEFIEEIIKQSNLSFEEIEKLVEKHPNWHWEYYMEELFRHPGFKFNFIIEHPEFNNFYERYSDTLIRHPKFNFTIMKRFINKNIRCRISKNFNAKMVYIYSLKKKFNNQLSEQQLVHITRHIIFGYSGYSYRQTEEFYDKLKEIEENMRPSYYLIMDDDLLDAIELGYKNYIKNKGKVIFNFIRNSVNKMVIHQLF